MPPICKEEGQFKWVYANPPRICYLYFIPSLIQWPSPAGESYIHHHKVEWEYKYGGVEEIEQSIKIRFVILKSQATVSVCEWRGFIENNQIIKRKSIH